MVNATNHLHGRIDLHPLKQFNWKDKPPIRIHCHAPKVLSDLIRRRLRQLRKAVFKSPPCKQSDRAALHIPTGKQDSAFAKRRTPILRQDEHPIGPNRYSMTSYEH